MATVIISERRVFKPQLQLLLIPQALGAIKPLLTQEWIERWEGAFIRPREPTSWRAGGVALESTRKEEEPSSSNSFSSILQGRG
jgi:hypothetical protein